MMTVKKDEATARPWTVEHHPTTGATVILDADGEEMAQVFHGNADMIVRAVNAQAGLVAVCEDVVARYAGERFEDCPPFVKMAADALAMVRGE